MVLPAGGENSVSPPKPTEPQLNADWWRTAVVYQIFPRSFADDNGDGIGDLRGVSSRLPYLASLGIDAIWLSPFYPSPLADAGYDITDHRDVDPRLGTLDHFDALCDGAHALGIKVIVDIVPNHTSDQHPWFQEALLAGPGSAARDRYIFRTSGSSDPLVPPTDWRSHFGGSAWEQVPDGEWYCHLFAREQPDLNWDNPEVHSYFLDTLRFWADRGVDGFRIDVAHALAKDLSDPLRSQPHLDSNLPLDGTDPLYDRQEVHEIYRQWRRVFDEYSPPKMAVAETWTPTNDRTYLYARPDELGQVFDFSLLKSSWVPEQFRGVISRSISSHASAGGGLTWVLSSHDVPRHASRLALPPEVTPETWVVSHGTEPEIDTAVGLLRARAATLMMLALPGSAYLFQGEELGLFEVADLPVDLLHDPIWHRSNGVIKGRDGCRVPLPWTTTGSSFGFGTNGSWIAQPEAFGQLSVAAQDGVEGSTLEFYRSALRLRRTFHQLASSPLEWRATDHGLLEFVRGDLRCIVNFHAELFTLDLNNWQIILASSAFNGDRLPANTAAWLVPR